ncbi:response regulator transcription factor [Campylobacter canadensis]|uniref:Response regulator transcription factor n=1 Tax=Campylobacter canadensis TaxID=449520 RepID=A0ABS7WT46_9BACT|nr:response regulator transcription factor [Campylobacter canadensis]MBZ7987944.1 response regulator transcription factor [Campylobacter canadensis]MBZ7995055.1 response regulator transcription factor [Campylobacter canadensis]MBZ7996669.1 response regulator transcription factor [Campylobacter canadensis]MBZ7998529.1 response regulator transcription factor [Campylobacter canadensis]MBZ8000276.1 response regulator transcription factor [Campylobacter canadensis]
MKNYTILYAEDDLKLANQVIDLLELLDFKVFYAKDGLSALEIIKEEKIDILLLDISMPRLDGLKLLEQIRQNDNKTPAIMITALSDSPTLLNAVELNICKYLIKPFDRLKLELALDKAIKQSNNLIKVSNNVYLNMLTNELLVNNELKKLSKKEFLLLEILLKSSPNIVDFYTICEYVYNDYNVSSDAIKSLVKNLRKKINYKGIIHNANARGYYIKTT